jgi:glycine/D-amino acid oxidase-like deaminating enzyme
MTKRVPPPDSEEAVVIIGPWEAVNAETRRVMGVAIGPELSPTHYPLKLAQRVQLALQEARDLLAEVDGVLEQVEDGWLSMAEAEARAAADVARAREIMRKRDEYEELPSSFAEACRKADERRARAPRDPSVERARFLMDDAVSFQAAYAAFDRERAKHGAPETLVEALMYSLRERGTAALTERDTRRRLGQLSRNQIDKVGDRLQRLPLNPRWTQADINKLIETWGACR